MHKRSLEDIRMPVLKENKFLSLLNRNRQTDLNRKQFVQAKAVIRCKQAPQFGKIKLALAEQAKSKSELESQVSHPDFFAKQLANRHQPGRSAEIKGKLRSASNEIKEKFRISNFYKTKEQLSPLRLSSKRKKKVKLRRPNNTQKQTDKNFCDFYTKSMPLKSIEPTINAQPTPVKPKLPSLPSKFYELLWQSQCRGLLHTKTAAQPPRKQSLKAPYSMQSSPRKPALKRIKSALFRPGELTQKRQSHRFSIKVAAIDSLFLNKFFKLKDKIFEHNRYSSANTNLFIDINSFMMNNYKSYWMHSIDNLLSQEKIDYVNHGYYRHKQISFGSFKLMNQAEKLCFLVHEDICKEKLQLMSLT